jgi:required for meiotic nuclear division protein 1
LESKLENFIENIEHVSEDLKNGKNFELTSAEILQKTGQLLTMRHLINLRFDLLNTPDYYWDREELEKLYTRTNSLLDIRKRTHVFNEKLNYCIDLMRILEANLNDKKHIRLEWIIILLISVEACIGILSFFIK